MTTQLLTGFTRVEMILYFFEQHKIGNFSSLFITNYIYNTFDLPEEKTLDQLSREVCAVLSTFFLHHTNHQINMRRFGIRKNYLYTYVENASLKMPKPRYVPNKNKKENFNIKPTQQTLEPIVELPIQHSLDLYATEETQENKSNININIHDPLQYLMDEIEKMNLPNLDQIILKSKINQREITITIS